MRTLAIFGVVLGVTALWLSRDRIRRWWRDPPRTRLDLLRDLKL